MEGPIHRRSIAGLAHNVDGEVESALEHGVGRRRGEIGIVWGAVGRERGLQGRLERIRGGQGIYRCGLRLTTVVERLSVRFTGRHGDGG